MSSNNQLNPEKYLIKADEYLDQFKPKPVYVPPPKPPFKNSEYVKDKTVSDINTCFTSIKGVISNFHSKVKEASEEQSIDFFKALNNSIDRMLLLHQQAVRAHAPAPVIASQIEKERDWFRLESLKLTKLCKKQ